jgi:HEAT repeat protein
MKKRLFPAIQLTSLLALATVGCGPKVELRMVHGQSVVHWVDELKRTDPKARRFALAALQAVGASDPAAVPAIVGALKDRDATVRDAAVIALLNIGSAAKDGVGALHEAKNDKDASVRAHAAAALERIEAGS